MKLMLRRFVGAALPAVLGALVWCGIASAAPPDPCATVMPLSDVADGMTGTGWTVRHGTDPESFDVEVLGVAKDFVAPGRDVIIAKISGPVVDEGGGVWAGMSGSPVYVGSDLIGAVAYGFALGPSQITGLTPAEDMLTVGGYPTSRATPRRVPLSRQLRTRIAAATGSSLATVGSELVRLRIPVSVSGIGSDRLGLVDKLMARHHMAAVAYAGSSVSAALTPGIDTLVPGGNFSAALSYGDVTFAGIGTTTYVCDGMALAFGHPMLLTGKSQLGAGGGDALAIVDDPTLSPFKLANVGAPLGRLDQDRFAGIRAVDGELSTTPIDTATSDLDTGLARVGHTDVVLPSEFSYISLFHLVGNIDTVFDQVGPGSSSLDWTISGERADGTPFELHRTNMYTSQFDLSFDSALGPFEDLDLLSFQPFEKIKFTGFDATASVQDAVNEYELTDLQVCRHGFCSTQKRISARRGQTLRFKAVLTPSDGAADQVVDFAFTIPRHAQAGALVQIGQPTLPYFCFAPEKCPKVIDSVDALLRMLARQLPNNVLHGTLRSGFAGNVKQRQNEVFDRVVSGSKWVRIMLPGQCCPPAPIVPEEEAEF